MAGYPSKLHKKIDGRAISYLRLSDNANRAARASREKTGPTVQQVEQVLNAMPANDNIQQRDRAIFAFVILTAARDAAVISLKRGDFDLIEKTVWQNPHHVKTKNGKGIVTRLIGQMLPLAEQIVLDWVKHIDDLGFNDNDPLFPKARTVTNLETMAFEVQGLSREHWQGAQPVRDIFKRAFAAVNLPYFNPHLARNTISKWGLKNLNQYQYKALSQNIGHEHAMTTYNSYAKLSESEQLEAIAGIGENHAELQNISIDQLLSEVRRRSGG